MERPSIEYKGFLITFIEEFEGEQRAWDITYKNKDTIENVHDCKSLKNAKQYVDNLVRKEFKRFPIIHKKRWGNGYIKAEVTSITEDNEFWVVFPDGERQKSREVLIDIQSNWDKINEISSINKEIEALHSKSNKIEKSLEKK